MNRYRREYDDPNVALTLALAALLVSIVVVHWLAHVGALALAGLAAGLVVALIASWVAFPARKLPRNRVRDMRLRARLRLRPGRGHASVFELWLRWGRLAAARRARRSRPSLSLLDRLFRPSLTSVLVARGQYNHACRVPVEEHVIYVAPLRVVDRRARRMARRVPQPAVVTEAMADSAGSLGWDVATDASDSIPAPSAERGVGSAISDQAGDGASAARGRRAWDQIGSSS